MRLASLGYAVPGTVLAIGLLLSLAWFDAGANTVRGAFGFEPRLLLMGSAAALVLAYLLRFLAIAAGGIESGFARIAPSLDQAAASLGHAPGARSEEHTSELQSLMRISYAVFCLKK